MGVQYIYHIGQYRDRLAVPHALANNLQGKVEAFFQPGSINNTQYLNNIGVY